jgi:tetratricopeptide (TPR) repeat protein
MRRFAVMAVCAAFPWLAAIGRAQDDNVYGSKGTPTRGRITQVSPDKVTLQAAGGARDFDVREIVRVTFGGEPRELASGRRMAAEGRYEDALKELENVKAEDITEDLIKQDVAYYLAYCQGRLALTSGGDRAAAISALKAFLGKNRNTFHFYDGVELLGDLNLAANDFAAAATFYGLLAKAPWPDYRMRAEIQLANAKCADGKYGEALPMYEKLLGSGLSSPETVQQMLHATVGKAVCLAATGKPQEAIKLLEEIIAKQDPSDAKLFARVYNALGMSHMKLGKTKEAILAFLHTEVLYSGDPDTAAEAQYYLAKLWDEVHNPDRANRARATLRSSYGGSRWAGKN